MFNKRGQIGFFIWITIILGIPLIGVFGFNGFTLFIFTLLIIFAIILGKQVKQKIDELKDLRHLEKVNTRNELYDLGNYEFESIVGKILKLIGFINIKQTKATVDMAVDLFADKDGESYVIECKKYDFMHKVSRRDLMLLESARHYFKRDKALFVTLSSFPKTAFQYAKEVGMELLDGNQLLKIHNKNITSLKPKMDNQWDGFLYKLAEYFYKEDGRLTKKEIEEVQKIVEDLQKELNK